METGNAGARPIKSRTHRAADNSRNLGWLASLGEAVQGSLHFWEWDCCSKFALLQACSALPGCYHVVGRLYQLVKGQSEYSCYPAKRKWAEPPVGPAFEFREPTLIDM